MRKLDRVPLRVVVSVALGLTFLPHVQVAPPSAHAGEAAAIEAPFGCDTPVPAASAGNSDAFGVGDKIKLAFYEQLQSQDEKWGARRQQGPSKNFFFRGELAGVYQVESDGTIAIPMLGRFAVRDVAPSALESMTRCAFERLIGRAGYVNVLSVVRPPVSVLGPVKTAGTYDYAPGMTVLHAIALAGGIERQPLQPWQAPEYTREIERLQTSLDRAARMMARAAVLKNERADDATPVTEALGQIAGPEAAASLTSEEAAVRRLSLMVDRSEAMSLKSAHDAAAADLDALKGRLEPLEKAIEMRKERVASLEKLLKTGNLGRVPVIQAQSDLAEVEARRQETVAQMSSARDRMTKISVDLEKLKVRSGTSGAQELAAAQIEYQRSLAEGGGALSIARSMAKAQVRAPSQQDVRYRVVRRTSTGVVTLQAEETTELKPGDVVQIVDASLAAPAAEGEAVANATGSNTEKKN